MADATAIFFVSPILIMALSVLFLGESVGWRRWTAAAVGLIGVLIVVRPGTGAFQPAAFLPILSASSWAVGAVVTRKISGDQALTTLAYSASVGSIVLSALMPFQLGDPERNGDRARAVHGHPVRHRALARRSGLSPRQCVDDCAVLLCPA